MDMICKTLDLIWRLQILASIRSDIDRLDSTHCRHSALILGFPKPDSRDVLPNDPFLTFRVSSQKVDKEDLIPWGCYYCDSLFQICLKQTTKI
jgi:hypothetical protein